METGHAVQVHVAVNGGTRWVNATVDRFRAVDGVMRVDCRDESGKLIPGCALCSVREVVPA